jgi:hypothetical protein
MSLSNSVTIPPLILILLILSTYPKRHALMIYLRVQVFNSPNKPLRRLDEVLMVGLTAAFEFFQSTGTRKLVVDLFGFGISPENIFGTSA